MSYEEKVIHTDNQYHLTVEHDTSNTCVEANIVNVLQSQLVLLKPTLFQQEIQL